MAQAIGALNNSNYGKVDANANAAGLLPPTLVSVNSNTSSWISDSGATDHIISHLFLLTNPKSSNATNVNLPNGVISQITHIGTVVFILT